MFSKYMFVIVTLFAMLCAASCGGTQLAAPVAEGPGAAGQPIPSVFDEFNGAVTRGASDVMTIPGSDALMNVGGTVDGTSMTIDSTGTAGDMAWALYQISGLAGRRASTLTIDLSLPTPDSQYSVGVSNFSDGVWDFLQPDLGDTQFEYNLTADEARLVSQLGNLYLVVVVSNGNAATILQSSLTSELETSNNEARPLRARRPSVSEGLADRIEVSWQAVDGADSYELWRRVDSEGDHQWELLATQAELTYTDTTIVLNTEYAYKVRSISTAGNGGFSEKRSGFAGTAPAGHNEAEDEDNEIKGSVTAVTETSFSIGDQTFAVDANTVFEGDAGIPATFADVIVGSAVEVQADNDNLGGWIARVVKFETEGIDDNGGQGGGGGDNNGGGGGDDNGGQGGGGGQDG